MEPLHRIWGLDKPPAGVKYGIELELEGMPHQPRARGWAITGDGSLRNDGVEYIFDGPRSLTTALDRIKNLCVELNALERKPIHNARTSVHIHIDVRWMTTEQLAAFISEWAAVEPLLFERYGSGREYSPYCVPLHVGREYTIHLLRSLEGGLDHVVHNFRNYKYTALSCNRFRDLGTMEARLFNSTCDTKLLSEYLFVCDMLATGSTAEDVARFMGVPDYQEGRDIRKLLEFEMELPILTAPMSSTDPVVDMLYRRDAQRVRQVSRRERGGGRTTGRIHNYWSTVGEMMTAAEGLAVHTATPFPDNLFGEE